MWQIAANCIDSLMLYFLKYFFLKPKWNVEGNETRVS